MNPQEVENLKQAFSKLSMKVSEKGTNSVSSIIKNYKNLIDVLSVTDPERVKYYKWYGYPDTVSMFDPKPKGFKSMSFKPHFSFEKVEEGLQNNTLFEGTIWKNEWNPDIAYIDVDGLNVDVLIDGIGNQNRAFDWDKVIFELLPSSEWQKKAQSSGLNNNAAIESRIVDEIYEEKKEESIFEQMESNQKSRDGKYW